METPTGDVIGRLRAARERLEAKDTPAAMAIYEEVLGVAGGRADVLVTVSGDLGSTGHVSEIIELVAPRYDARRHGPATGFNLLQAYIAVRDSDAAQHILDLLFELNRPELEERLYGFSNVIADLLLAESTGQAGQFEVPPEAAAPAEAGRVKIALATISKPIWFYGLEAASADILPPKAGKLRRVAFAQLALPGATGPEAEELQRPGGELAMLSRALPIWFAEQFYFTAAYEPFAALAFFEQADGRRNPMIMGAEWTTENLRQLVDTTEGGLDYIFTGALRQKAGDYELVLRLWEVKKFRERKVFSSRWTPGIVDAELDKLRSALCHFMEWAPRPPGTGLAFTLPAAPREWLEVLGCSLSLFLADKKMAPKEWVGPLEPAQRILAKLAPQSAAASLVWLTLRQRADSLGLPLSPEITPSLADAPVVRAAQSALGVQG